MRFRDYDLVEIVRAFSPSIPIGTRAHIVHRYADEKGVELECLRSDGSVLGVVTASNDDIRLVRRAGKAKWIRRPAPPSRHSA